MLFAKSGRYVLLRGIHHMKLVISGDRLRKAKAYVFMVLSRSSFRLMSPPDGYVPA